MRRLLLVLALVTAGCKTSEPAPAPSAAVAQPASIPPGIDPSAMRPEVDPCQDFYEYACGGWLAGTPIPEDRSRWSRGFDSIAQRNEDVLRELLEAASRGEEAAGSPDQGKLGAFYGACMDEGQQAEALSSLHVELGALSPKDARELASVLGRLHARGGGGFFWFGPTTDARDASLMIAEVDQAGLGLPDRDYYLEADERKVAVREAYRAHIQRVFELLGDGAELAARKAEAVLRIEMALAQASATRVERRDPEKVYNRLERAGLRKLAPAFPWDAYFEAVGAPAGEALNVTSPRFFEAFSGLLAKPDPAAWRAYLGWHLIQGVIDALPAAVQEESFRFQSAHLTGAKEDPPRWKKCVRFTDEALGEALAQPFIERTFGQDGKAKTQQMVVEIGRAFEANLDALAWMDDATRERAREKARALVNKIGFPDRWRSYEALEVSRESFLRSLLEARRFETARQLKKIGQPIDKGEWFMSPPTVNAYYYAAFNEIVFPAGILQPPFFERTATDAVNFGAMGMVVGHEITHGFDDTGRLYDARGNLQAWWTEASDQAFRERAGCVRDQFASYTAIDDVRVNGELTLGENVADLGGLKLSHAAMRRWVERNPPAAEHRFSQSQQFFLGFAQSWCSNMRPEMARVRAVTDSHSPPFLRVNGPLRNLPEFQEAFSCKQGDAMVRPAAERCEVW